MVAAYLGYKAPERLKTPEELRHMKRPGELSIVELQALGKKFGIL
jgi:hypothetical protein